MIKTIAIHYFKVQILRHCVKIETGEETTPLSKKYSGMMSSTVLLQLNFYLQKFIFYNAKINHSNHS